MKPAEYTTPYRTPKKQPQKPIEGVISDLESYSVAEFRRRLKIGVKMWRNLKNGGLKIRTKGNRLFILGTDWHEFLRKE